MPNPEEIAAYHLEAGIIYRLRGNFDLKMLPLAADKIRIEWRRKSTQTFKETWFERHFDVVCIDNAVRIVPTAAIPYDGKPEIDPYTLGTASPDAIASAMTVVNEVVRYAGAIIGEHICRTRLENWRVASIAGDERDVEALWFDYLQAETAMAWTYPAYECDFIAAVEESSAPRI